ncbi:MAG: tRNA 2-thiouridine(34) synthase MnmA [bacterium]|nr:tRNA 2-thiouridine(34) synthase MnmA [Gammaproteobacteria bacterium]HIL96827.1 tRNA 2-thiouridine(34) synthase MnmA [Pseudomonadales bacterium]
MTRSKVPETVIVGMSGGVDSSVSAKLLLDQGYSVQGLFMKNWEEDDGTEYCTARQDLIDAQSVCEHLGIELHQANFAAEYWDNVFEQFLREYRAGRTPNPDILCNREIKFNVFREYAELLGADYIATGHYARLDHSGSAPRLLKGLDPEKDQSYFLQSVSARQLTRCLFPIGELIKTNVRQIAEEAGIPTHAKKDSTGICFIGERRFKDFLSRYIPARPGPIKTLDEQIIGEHQGVMFHTLGQRQGLGIGGVSNTPDAPWYVVKKDIPGNTLYIAQGNDHDSLFSSAMTCLKIEWVDGLGPTLPRELCVKTRYRQPDQHCRIERHEGVYRITFGKRQRAVTPGQWACFYEDDHCLGGGIIESTEA